MFSNILHKFRYSFRSLLPFKNSFQQRISLLPRCGCISLLRTTCRESTFHRSRSVTGVHSAREQWFRCVELLQCFQVDLARELLLPQDQGPTVPRRPKCHFYPNVTTLRFGLCYLSSVCLSVCRLSVMLVHPTQGVEPFGNIS